MAYKDKQKQREANTRWAKANRAEVSAQQKRWCLANPERVTLLRKRRYALNKDKIKEQSLNWKKNNLEQHRLNCRRWRESNREYINQQDKIRRNTDPNFKLRTQLRARIRTAIKNGVRAGSAVRDLGCSLDECRKYLETKFTEKMSWANHGYGAEKWNIDHVIPLSYFDLTDRAQFLQAVHYTNLQPMWQPDNFKKHNKLPDSPTPHIVKEYA